MDKENLNVSRRVKEALKEIEEGKAVRMSVDDFLREIRYLSQRRAISSG